MSSIAERRSPATRDPAVWARHVTWAKVFMTGIAALHESKIVHADLKPANAYLIKDPTIGAGLPAQADRHGLLAPGRPPRALARYQGYVGTDNYRSPEHMTRGAVPGLASDIFTCGLMLYELLAGYHPYWTEDQAEYAKLVQSLCRQAAGTGRADAGASEQCRGERHPPPLPLARSCRETDGAELRAVLSGRGAKTHVATKPATRAAATGSPVPTAAHGPLRGRR